MADTTIIGLCSGVGMLEEGIAAGLRYLGRKPRVLCHVERDAYAASVLLARMEVKAMEPSPVWVGNLEDVRWEQFAGAVDIVSAGFPCQPHSMAGSRKGTDDDRWIWPAIADCIRRVGPGIVLLENVPGLRSSGGFAPVLTDLAALGFRIEWDSVRASDVGASHQRERVFVMAYKPEHRRTQGRAESSGIIRRSDAAECGCAMDDTNGSKRRQGGIGGSCCEQRPDGKRKADCGVGVSGAALLDDPASARHYREGKRTAAWQCSGECLPCEGCENMGNTPSERRREARQCCGARESGACEYGAELADAGCMQRQTGYEHDRPDSPEDSKRKGDDRTPDYRGIMADTSQPRPEGREQHGTYVADGRTDEFTISTSFQTL